MDKKLPFFMQVQREPVWCWAAAAACVSRSYNPESEFTQCEVVKQVLEISRCADGIRRGSLEAALRVTRNLQTVIRSARGFDFIKDEINAGRIVCVWHNLRGDGGHFTSIYGYDDTDGLQFLHIYDTFEDVGEVTKPYDEFKTNYCNLGRWRRTYYTNRELRPAI